MGRFVVRRGAGPAVAYGLVGAGVSFLGLPAVRSFVSALVLVSAASVFTQLALVGYDTLRATVTAEQARGQVLGAIGSMSNLSSAAIVPLVGRWASASGPGVALYAGALLCAAGAALALSMDRPEREPATRRAGPPTGGRAAATDHAMESWGERS